MAFDDFYYEELKCEECNKQTLEHREGFIVCTSCGLVYDRAYAVDKALLRHTEVRDKHRGTYIGYPRRKGDTKE